MKKTTISLMIFFAMATGLNLMTHANRSDNNLHPHLVYNDSQQTYYLQGAEKFSSQPLEQKFITLQSINKNETKIAARSQNDKTMLASN